MRFVREEISKEISAIRDSVLNLEKSAVTVYDVENGDIQIEFYLPVALENLQSFPKLKVLTVLRKFKSMIPGYGFDFCDYIPDTDYANWIPPFSGNLVRSSCNDRSYWSSHVLYYWIIETSNADITMDTTRQINTRRRAQTRLHRVMFR